MSKFYWGVDLGGTKTEGVVIDPSDPLNPLARERIPTESDKGYQHILFRIKELIEILKNKTNLLPEKVGFGTPGILDRTLGTMKNCNTTCLNGQPLNKDLEKILNVPVELANDANCFALSEALYGSATGASAMFGVIMGTGVGGGVVVNNKIHAGLHGIAGEWGHNVLEQDGEACYCGKYGCVEKVISGPALERFYTKLSGKTLKLNQILALNDDPHARATLQRLVQYFGKAISVVINILDPDVIVLGGGLSNIDALYNQGIAEISKHIFNNRVSTKIVKNKLGDSAGVFGAALLCHDK